MSAGWSKGVSSMGRPESAEPNVGPGSGVGSKRPLDAGLGSPGDSAAARVPPEKRQRVPALASVVVEAVKMDSLQKLFSGMEPLLRRVVGEEVEKALAKLMPTLPRLQGPSGGVPRQLLGAAEGPARKRKLRLQFVSKLALPLFTGARVEGEGGSAVLVVLQYADSGHTAMQEEESSLKLEVVVLEGDFNTADDEDWSEEDFENNSVRERDGKRPLLAGDLTFSLKEGVGTLGDVQFTDNSSWIRSRKFRLGVRVHRQQPGDEEDEGAAARRVRVREAKTEPFTVKDHRGELYKKHYPPALNDEVWRLDRIGKDGAFHKRLNQEGIRTVEDLLRYVIMDPQKLRNILGSGMSNKMWENVVEHAKTCVLNGKLYVYYADEKQNIGVIFNNIFQLMGLVADSQYMSVDALSESEKVYVERLVKLAYEKWENVVEYEGEALMGMRIVPATAAGPIQSGPGQGPGQGQGQQEEGGRGQPGGEVVVPKVEQQQLGTDTNSMGLAPSGAPSESSDMSSVQASGAVPQLPQPYYGAEQGPQGGGYAYPAQALHQQLEQQQHQAMWQVQVGTAQRQGQYGEPLADASLGGPSLATQGGPAAGVPGAEYGDGREWQQGAGGGPDGGAAQGREAGAGEGGRDGDGEGDGDGGWGSGEGDGLATPTGPVQGEASFSMSGSLGGAMGGGAGPPYFGLEELGLSEDELRSKSMQMLSENDDMHQQMQQLLGMLGDYAPSNSAGTITANLVGSNDDELQFRGAYYMPPADGSPGMGDLSVSGAAAAATAAAAAAAVGVPQGVEVVGVLGGAQGGGVGVGGGAGGVEGRHHQSSKVGWLKLKAALQWGIFIRKRAAQRRARLEEVDPDADDLDT